MNQYAMLHIVDSSYCFPIGKNEITLRLRTAKDDMKEVWVVYESKYVIGTTQKKARLEKKFSGQLYDYYSVTLNLKDTRIGYVFYVYDGKDYMYFSEDGLTKEYDFTLGFYNFFQYPYINEADIMPKVNWTKNAVFYQIFVERFAVGDKNWDKSYVNMKWGDIPTPKSFAGGDIKGIINELDYIKGLGVNTIYLTPVFKSISNHKYDIIDYYEVDSQFGSNEDLKELVMRAHDKGIRIVLDAVFNHCSYECRQFQDVMEKGIESPYYDWFVIYGDKPDPKAGNYEMFASCDYMPKLNTSNKAVTKFLCDIGCHYVTNYNIDGWRLDVSDEVSHEFWREFRKRIKECNSECVIIGENWHDASNYLRGDQYDSIMNYSFTKLCLDYFAKDKMDAYQAAGKLNDILARNTDTVNTMMLNLLDSHDTFRFFTEVKCDEEKMKAALALLFMFPGMPCIYYGTELFMQGGYDPDCRRCMDWDGIRDNKYSEYISYIKKLAAIRNKDDLAGADAFITATDNVLIVKRTTDTKTYSLYINLTDNDECVESIHVNAHSHVLKEELL